MKTLHPPLVPPGSKSPLGRNPTKIRGKDDLSQLSFGPFGVKVGIGFSENVLLVPLGGRERVNLFSDRFHTVGRSAKTERKQRTAL